MKLIDKDALVAEIERLLDKGKYHDDYDCVFRDGNNSALYALKVRINTLEVKEVDLEKETDKWYNNEASKEFENVLYKDIEKCAKHFFELGMQVSNKAQKGKRYDR